MGIANQQGRGSFSAWLKASARRAKHKRLKERLAPHCGMLPDPLHVAVLAWTKQLVRRRKSVPLPLAERVLIVAVRSLSRSAATSPAAVRDLLRFAMRIVTRDQDTTTVDAVIQALRAPFSEWRAGLVASAAAASHRFQARKTGAVTVEEVTSLVNEFLTYIGRCVRQSPPSVRFDADERHSGREPARSQVNAFNDSVLHLPAALCSPASPGRRLSIVFATLYLPLHEFAHTFCGSFAPFFDSPRGTLLWNRLERSFGAPMLSASISPELYEKLLAEGANERELMAVEPSDLMRFLAFFPPDAHKLIQHLWNAAEDGRIERQIERRWPSIAELNRAFSLAESREVLPSAYCLSKEDALVNAIAMTLAGRPFDARLPRSEQQCYMGAKSIIDRQESRESESLVDSLETVLDLYLLLENHASAESGGGLGLTALQATRWAKVSFEEIAARQHLKHSPSAYGGPRGPQDGPPSDESFEDLDDRGAWFPESPRGSVHVAVKDAGVTAAQRKPTPITLPFPNLSAGAWSGSRRGKRARFGIDATRLDVDRLAEWRAGVASGRPGALPYCRRQSSSPVATVSLVFDLSASMLTKRACLGGDSAFDRAVQAGQWIAQGLAAQGVDVEVFGGLDGGPKLARLFQVHAHPATAVTRLEPLGAGGFRLGAFTRALTERPVELRLPAVRGHHHVVAFTDGDGTYVGVGAERAFSKVWSRNCPTCARARKERGVVEVRSFRRNEGLESLFLPVNYELRDVRAARQEAERRGAGLSVLVFNDDLPKAAWDEVLGPENWSLILSPEELTVAVKTLVSKLEVPVGA